MIKKLENNLTEELCAQQVITNLPDCIKQLIDNSIDAQATTIRIILEQYGKIKIQLIDDGIGISNFDCIGLKGITSKNKYQENQNHGQNISTLGFRGQALHSIARVSKEMKIDSKIQNCPSYCLNLKNMKLEQTLSINRGTKVQVEGIFQYLPVRRNQLLNRYKEFLKDINQLIKQYCLGYPKIKFTLINIHENREYIIIDTHRQSISNNKFWHERIAQILGLKIADKLVYIQSDNIAGFILNKIESGSSYENSFIKKNICYMFINNRPIDHIKMITQLFDSIYKKYNPSTKYIYILNLRQQQINYDINLTPNKREVIIKKNIIQRIISQLKKQIQIKVIEEIPVLNNEQKIIQKLKQNPQKIQKQVNMSLNLNKKQKINIDNKNQKQIQKNTNLIEALNDKMSKIRQIEKKKFPQNNFHNKFLQQKQQQKKYQFNNILKQNKIYKINNTNRINEQNEQNQLNTIYQKQQKYNNNQLNQQINQKKEISQNISNLIDLNIQKKQNKQISQKLNQEQIKITFNKYKQICNDFKIQDFKKIQILGQFNNGFIICKFNNKYMLIDQHAASQKQYFEKMMEQQIQLISKYEKQTIDNITADSIESNIQSLIADGFKFHQLNQDRNIIILERCPMFLGSIYGINSMIQLAQSNKRLREIPQFYNKVASKACRIATMVGEVLSEKQMKNIVYTLAELKSPWNCPHGRPTIIELAFIDTMLDGIKFDKIYQL